LRGAAARGIVRRMDLGLKDRVCVVTGASVGIGRAVARLLLAEGARVVAVARREALLNELRGAMAVPLDLTADDAAERLKQTVLGAFGRVDAIVNNAGGSRPSGPLAEEPVWEEGMRLNFTAARRLTQAFIPSMRAQKWGRIVNVTGSDEPLGSNAALPAKAAATIWAKGLSRDLGRDGITVNCVAPGRIMSEQVVEKLHPTEEERRRFAEANIPLRRFGEPEEIAALIVFLCSEAAGYITGDIFHVDGGMRRFAF
jgi:3-oxoacyl-[acyl-carrier protein] reductase